MGHGASSPTQQTAPRTARNHPSLNMNSLQLDGGGGWGTGPIFPKKSFASPGPRLRRCIPFAPLWECPWVAALSQPPPHRYLCSLSLALAEQLLAATPVPHPRASSTTVPQPNTVLWQEHSQASPACPAHITTLTTSGDGSPPRGRLFKSVPNGQQALDRELI